jgi:hypothetical protein
MPNLQQAIAIILLGMSLTTITDAQDWAVKSAPLQTRWADTVNPANVLPEYPRPQLVRPQWTNLNGLWQYAITPSSAGELPSTYAGDILVPYPLESALSGVQLALKPDQFLWYRREFKAPAGVAGAHTLLHFGAVDWGATVYVNGSKVANHSGGYQSFTVDITDALKTGDNDLVVKVFDPSDQGNNPHGKQTLSPQGILYTASSGIWQTVWMETVPTVHVDDLVITPDVDSGALHLRVNLAGEGAGYTVQAVASAGGQIVATQTIKRDSVIPIPHAHLWSPNDPFLYDLEIRLVKGSKVVDEVKSYFGMRKVEIKKDEKGIERIYLNNVYTHNLGVLDQGFWPDGLYTAPTDEALKFDIQAIKAMGFNTIRKHVKVEPARWYYDCDTLGMLVWQDLVNPGNDSAEGKAEFERESAEELAQLHNFPSITTWVVFNEGWGAYDQARLTKWVKELDPSRLVNGHTGENMFQGSPPFVSDKWANSDMTDVHAYPDPVMPPKLPGKAQVLGEFGGVGASIQAHEWNETKAWGYAKGTPADLATGYYWMMRHLKLDEEQGLTGSIYTQPFDVEGEENGLMTYDRAVIKMPLDDIRTANALLVPATKPANFDPKTFAAETAAPTYAGLEYPGLLEQYNKGRRDPGFVRSLARLARDRRDDATAAKLSTEYLATLKDPWTADDIAFMSEFTQSSKAPAFARFFKSEAEFDQILKKPETQRFVDAIITREEITPRLPPVEQVATREPDWAAITESITTHFDKMHAERTVSAGKVDWYRSRKDRRNYLASLVANMNQYGCPPDPNDRFPAVCWNNPAWEVFEASSDPRELMSALAWAQHAIELDPKGQGYWDTYANLLYKLGDIVKAIEAERKAVAAQKAEDANDHRAIADLELTIDKMTKGVPTWPLTPAVM